MARQPAETRGVLDKVRAIIRKAVPKADEVISYQIPAYKLDGELVIFFAGWKKHFSLYPATGRVVEELAAELEGYERSKGTVRFPLDEKIPVALIEKIVKIRLEDAKERAAEKAAKKPARKKSPAKKRRVRV